MIRTSMIQKMSDEERKSYLMSLDTVQIGSLVGDSVKLTLLYEEHRAPAVIQQVRAWMPTLTVVKIMLIVRYIEEYHAPYGEPVEYEEEWLKLAEELKVLAKSLRA